MIDPSLRVRVVIGGEEHVWTLAEANEVLGRIASAREALKVKCPTCRCRIYPGATWGCCAEPLCSDGESLV